MTTYENSPNVFLFIANVMDYGRVVMTAAAFYYAKSDPILFLILYFISFALDMFDGMAARYFNQSSKYGATLDMIIDRISTSGLLIVCSHFYPEYSLIFIYLMMLDIGSHWLQTHSGFLDPKLLQNPDLKLNDNHKNLEEKFWILNFYYKNKYGLLFVCLGAELFLLQIYYLNFHKELLQVHWFNFLLYMNMAIYSLKQIISVIQVVSASNRIVRFDQKEIMIKRTINKQR
jgi:CDP-diacylglycerol--inositol 3-phosphatidyltransferase